MSGANKKTSETTRFLDNLTSFLTGDNREIGEIVDSLQMHGIDPEQSLAEFREILSKHAPTWREQATRERRLAQASIEHRNKRTRQSRPEVERRIREIVESMRTLGVAIEVGAFHRKFQEARDEDLDSLLEDLELQRNLLLKKQDKA